MRRYEDSMFRERNVYSAYPIHRTQTNNTRRNFRWAYRQACVHKRLLSLYQEYTSLLSIKSLPYDVSTTIARIAVEPE